MKLSSASVIAVIHDRPQSGAIRCRRRWLTVSGCGLVLTSLVGGVPLAVKAETTLSPQLIAQSVGLPPIPYASSSALPGEQYIVIVNGNSDLLLEQIRQIEPGAFVNFVDGREVIQAGRFSAWQNAQFRADELARFGIGAEVKSTAPVSAPIASSSYYAPPTAATATATTPTLVGDLPPIPTTVTPTPVEFGQSPEFGLPPQPTTVLPPPSTAAPSAVLPPTAAIANQPQTSAAGYYVVIPGRVTDLSNLANQVIRLGVPASLVQTRSAPRGHHVAVGPYADYGIAQEWSNYLRDQGLGARVHFQ